MPPELARLLDPPRLPDRKQPTDYEDARRPVVEEERTNGLDSGLMDFKEGVSGDDDPTFRGFTVKFAMNSDHSPLFNGEAEEYLNMKGRNVNAELLAKAKNQLVEIQDNRPWYFQSFEGLDGIENMGMQEFDPHDHHFHYVVNLVTWEDLSWRVQNVIEFYRRAVYDFNSWRFLLPENLRHFELEIRIGEMRRIRSGSGDYNETQPFKSYKFSHCQFLWEEDSLSTGLDNAEPERYENGLGIGLGPYSVMYQAEDGTVFTDDDLRKSHMLDNGDTNLDRISSGNSDERFMDREGDYRTESYTHAPREETATEPQSQEGRLARIRGAATDFLRREIENSAGSLKRRINREINQTEASVRQGAQNAIDAARNQANRRLQSIVPDASQEVDEFRMDVSPVGGDTDRARDMKEDEVRRERQLGDVNVYERILENVRDDQTIIIGNVYD